MRERRRPGRVVVGEGQHFAVAQLVMYEDAVGQPVMRQVACFALARCHRGGSPRTFQRAASSPRGAQATPHPGKRNDRAPPPPASPRHASPCSSARAHAPTRPRSLRESEATLQASSEPGAKRSRLEPRTGSTTAAGGSCKGIKGSA